MGDLLHSVTRRPITTDDLKAYSDASLDFNPIHLDPVFAKQAGFPSVIAHGMLSMAYLGDYLHELFPEDKYCLKRFSSRFRKVTFPGDVLTCEGKIKAIQLDGCLILSLWIRSQKGEVTVEGEAEIKVLTP